MIGPIVARNAARRCEGAAGAAPEPGEELPAASPQQPGLAIAFNGFFQPQRERLG